MRTRRTIIVLAALLAVAIALLLLWQRFGDQENAAAPIARSGTPIKRLSSPQAPRVPSRTLEWLVEPGAPEQRVAGRVLFDGAPVHGATVTLHSEIYSLAEEPHLPTRTTGKDGEFDFGMRPPTMVTVWAAADGLASRSLFVDLKHPIPHTPHDALELSLAECSSMIRGTVVDEGGGPVVDGELQVVGARDGSSWGSVVERHLLTESGTFAICAPGHDRGISYRIAASGYGTQMLPYTMPPGGHRVTLFAAGSVSGTVVDDQGDSIEGVRVSLLYDHERGAAARGPLGVSTVSDAAGRFTFEAVTAGAYELAGDVAGYHSVSPWTKTRVEAGQHVEDTKVPMTSCRRIAGTVTDPDGAPLVAAKVWYKDEFGRPLRTLADGSFRFPCATYDAFELEVRGHTLAKAGVPAGTENMDDLDLVATALDPISGTVTSGGRSLEGIDVSLGSTGADLSPFGGLRRQARSNREGHYSLGGVPPGTYELRAHDRTGKVATNTITVTLDGGRSGLDIEMEPATELILTLVDAQGASVPNANIEVLGADGAMPTFRDRLDGTTNEDGQVTFQGVGPGAHKLCIGYCFGDADELYAVEDESDLTVAIPEGAARHEHQVTLSARHGQHLEVEVTWQDGTPVSHAAVDTSRRLGLVRTDDAGRATLGPLLEGVYAISATAPTGETATIEDVSVPGEGLTLTLARFARLDVALASQDASCAVELSSQDAVGTRPASIRREVGVREGHAHFDGLPTGSYALEARCSESDELHTGAVTLTAGEEKTISLEKASTSPVRLQFMNLRTGKPVDKLRCSIGLATETTDSGGELSFSAMAHGPVTLRCQTVSTSDMAVASAELSFEGTDASPLELFAVRSPLDALRDEQGVRLGAELVPGQRGLEVGPIEQGSVAERAGLLKGDVLIAFHGRPLPSSQTTFVSGILSLWLPGTALPVTVQRGTETVELILRY